MNQKNKSDSTILNSPNRPAPIAMPVLSLSMTDKMYLALMYQEHNRLAFIYTLFCRQDLSGGYCAVADQEVLVFKRSSDAKVYYETLQQIQHHQSATKNYQGLVIYNQELIKQFNNMQH